MTGDIHQPLHVGAAYIGPQLDYINPATPAEAAASFTEGGNFMCIGSSGLHSHWDSDYVKRAMQQAGAADDPSYAAQLIGRPSPPVADTGDPIGWPTLWATDSLKLANSVLASVTVTKRFMQVKGTNPCKAATTGIGTPAWSITLPSAYVNDAVAIVPVQLQKAGYRLAAVLKAIWP
jgi:hypothetical protein